MAMLGAPKTASKEFDASNIDVQVDAAPSP